MGAVGWRVRYVREQWWGGMLLAAASGVVGLAEVRGDPLFRRPLGLPIPHTALVPSNWEALAQRVGTMVGDRVLTKAYVTDEIGRVDLAGLLATGASRITREDLEALTRTVARWLVTEVTPGATGELLARIRGSSPSSRWLHCSPTCSTPPAVRRGTTAR